MTTKMMKISAVLVLMSGGLVACSSSEKVQSKVHPAVLSAQDYFIDHGMPVREVKKEQIFFFKKCDVDNTGPWPTKTTYDCNEL